MKKRLLIVSLCPLYSMAMECYVDELASYAQKADTPIAGQLYVDADSAQATPQKAHFSGNVVAKQDGTTFHSHLITYDRVNKHITTPKQNIIADNNVVLKSQSGEYSLTTEKGTFTHAEYYLAQQQALGSAKSIRINRKENIETLTSAKYTTCRRQNPTWHLKAKEIKLNHNTGVGTSWHNTFHIGSVPVMYLPYLSFPLNNQRKSGFLFPKTTLSKQRGVDITLPYYINIAPNQDATLSPRIMSKRGVMLGTEYRYLLKNARGIVAGTYLHNDKRTHTKRWSFKTHHTITPSDKLSLELLYQRVSDKNYFKNFNSSFALDYQTVLESRAQATYQLSPNYRLSAKVSKYQIAKPNYSQSDAPYDIVPHVSGYGEWDIGNWTLKSDTTITNFDKKDTVSGIRAQQQLSASYEYETSYAFVKPTFTYRLSSYQLRNRKKNEPESITRSIPTFSIDSGLYFDRQTQLFGRSITQTLSPRLFYLRTPYSDQSDIPNFDSKLVTGTYNSLFLNNRFNGKDRVGDANQLTTAVSTSFIDNTTGRELATFSAGQIQYFQDRRVTLNNAIKKTSRSNIIAEARIAPTDTIKINGLIHYDTSTSNTEKSLIGISYQKERDKGLFLTHSYDQTYYKQVDFSGVWRLDDNWRSFWRWNYAIDYNKTIDMMAGIEYADCCWGVRVLGSQKRNKVDQYTEPENTISIEFIFKGLGGVGSNSSSELKRVIPSYQPIHYEQAQTY